ncbi:hypothetical protein M3Y98_00132900 [Aphelenchoides besseyi]|nr:hypothetical protein M3Y98_00132900 [Aphelenchoides besseyi]KAI6199629.1 hypothetical protein M3Y96_00647200 [Aphelenchoides besseyi]
MSRGKNAYRRGNKTLAWYIPDSKLLDKSDQERDETPSPLLTNRKSSVDSQSSGNSAEKQQSNEENAKKRKNRNRPNRTNSQQPTSKDPTPASSPPDINVQNENTNVLPQQFSALAVGVQKDRDSYFYYDIKSDGFYYEQNGSRGWRKRNPKLHGNPPLSVGRSTDENVGNQLPQPQTIEKKVYVPVPVPVFTSAHSTSKFFPPASNTQNLPNIKYYDAASDGFFYALASVDGWRRRNPTSNQQLQQNETQNRSKQESEFESSSLSAFPPLERDLSVTELENLVLSNVSKIPTHNSSNNLQFASAVARGSNQRGIQTAEHEYPSSVSTISSDDVTPPPPSVNNGHQTHLYTQSQDLMVGSFDEPYEFYWSDNEKTERPVEPASSVSSADDGSTNPMSTYFQQMRSQSDLAFKAAANRVKRPSSLKIADQTPINEEQEKRAPRFNVDKFIADLPFDNEKLIHTLTAACTPFTADTTRSSFNYFPAKDSPLFTPNIPQMDPWSRPISDRFCDYKTTRTANSDIEQKMVDIEKIWQSTGF